MKFGTYLETPKERGKRYVQEDKVKIFFQDNYEIRFQVTNDKGSVTEVSFIKSTKEIKCFNAQCSLWRGQRENKEQCYHKFAVQSKLNIS
jgi:hypothetical protein